MCLVGRTTEEPTSSGGWKVNTLSVSKRGFAARGRGRTWCLTLLGATKLLDLKFRSGPTMALRHRSGTLNMNTICTSELSGIFLLLLKHALLKDIVSHLDTDLCLGLNGTNEVITKRKVVGDRSQIWQFREGNSFTNKLGKALDVPASKAEKGKFNNYICQFI